MNFLTYQALDNIAEKGIENIAALVVTGQSLTPEFCVTLEEVENDAFQFWGLIKVLIRFHSVAHLIEGRKLGSGLLLILLRGWKKLDHFIKEEASWCTGFQ